MNDWNHFRIGGGTVLAVLMFGWLLWYWLKHSDEGPVRLMLKWLITGVLISVALALFVHAMPLASIPFAFFTLLVLGFVWAPHIGNFIGGHVAGVYEGSGELDEPPPFYAVAEAHRKRGEFEEAAEEVGRQLARYPEDFAGQMLLAEITAEDLHDMAEAERIVEGICGNENFTARQVAQALSQLAEWHLKLRHDLVAARKALERIMERFPDTPQAQAAAQRLAQLTPRLRS